jgi:hypothetical protein
VNRVSPVVASMGAEGCLQFVGRSGRRQVPHTNSGQTKMQPEVAAFLFVRSRSPHSLTLSTHSTHSTDFTHSLTQSVSHSLCRVPCVSPRLLR